MMGPKKLSTIREELASHVAPEGEDPIRWLEQRIQQLEKERKPNKGMIDVLESLRRVLEMKLKPKRRRPRSAS